MWHGKAKARHQLSCGIHRNPHLETLPKVLILWGMPEELQIGQARRREEVTHLQEARPPMAEESSEHSPAVFERAIKNQMLAWWGRGGTWVAEEGLVLLERSTAL